MGADYSFGISCEVLYVARQLDWPVARENCTQISSTSATSICIFNNFEILSPSNLLKLALVL